MNSPNNLFLYSPSNSCAQKIIQTTHHHAISVSTIVPPCISILGEQSKDAMANHEFLWSATIYKCTKAAVSSQAPTASATATATLTSSSASASTAIFAFTATVKATILSPSVRQFRRQCTTGTCRKRNGEGENGIPKSVSNDARPAVVHRGTKDSRSQGLFQNSKSRKGAFQSVGL